MKYRPGSFSKNFAWHGTSLHRLHAALVKGFHNKCEAVRRAQFRLDCGIDDSNLQLIPINFFLFNRRDWLVVDELVFQSLNSAHSLDFDRLGLFALHLSNVGDVSAGGTGWAREFVKKRLWQEGFWNRDALVPKAMDEFLSDVLVIQSNKVLVKCRTNYRHLFELCDYIPPNTGEVDNRSEGWVGPAMFLAWDRAILSAALLENEAALVDYISREEIYKLIGISNADGEIYARTLAPRYLESGGLRRFESISAVQSPGQNREEGTAKVVQQQMPPSAAEKLAKVAQELREEEVARKLREVNSQQRNVELAVGLKELYGNICMFCGEMLLVGLSPRKFYVEAAHIKPLGMPYNGPDIAHNMLVLCPNCHKQFDGGVVLLQKHGATFSIIAPQEHRLKGKEINIVEGHKVSAEYVGWHRDYWQSRRRK